MNRKQWKEQGRQSDDLVIVLRRRAKQLASEEHFNEQYIGVFLRAADELEARRSAAIPGGDEQLAVDAICDNRRLRHTLVEVYNQIRARKPAGWPEDVMRQAKNTLAAVRPFGDGRRILSVQIGDDSTRASIEAMMAEQLDGYFNKGAIHGDETEEEESAGRDDAERASGENTDRRAEGEAAEGAARDGERSGPAPGAAD